MAESRLRTARLYRTPSPRGARNLLSAATLRVEVPESYFVRVSFLKYGPDLMSLTTRWETYAGDDEHMRKALSEILDHFVLEYMRVNEAACGQ